MNRRAVLAVALGAFTGCTGKPTDLATPRPTSSSTAIEEASPNEPSSTVDAPSLAELGNPPTVCAGGLVDLGIYAIDDPVFDTDWSTVTIPDQYSEDGELGDTVVIGIETDRGARAYPLSILWYHEIVNDTLPDSDDPILVTYCSLCRSGMVAERIVAGSPTIFGVTGQLWQPPELEAHASADQSRVFAVEPNDPAPRVSADHGKPRDVR